VTVQVIEVEPGAALAEAAEAQRKLAAALVRLGRTRDQDVRIGTTPKDEVLRIDKTVLYRYRPVVERPARVPVLLSYALVGRYTVLDLQEDRSLVRNLLAAGLDVYLADWGHPSRADKFAGIDDYVNDYLAACVEEIRCRHELDAVDLLGVCQGGFLSLCYAALHPGRVRRLITTVTPVDFHADKGSDRIDRGFMNVWARSLEPGDVDRLVDTLGTVPGEFVGYLFSLMTPGRSLTKYNLDLVEAASGDDAKLLNFLRMERWLADRPAQPGEFGRQWLKDLYQDNKLVRDELVLDGRAVRLRDITCPVLNVYTETDHIIPPEMSAALKGRVGTEDYTEVVLKAGHIGIFVSPRALDQLSQTVVDWLAKGGLANGADVHAEATSSGGREGRVRTADGAIDLPLSMPRELGGPGRPGPATRRRCSRPATPPASRTRCSARRGSARRSWMPPPPSRPGSGSGAWRTRGSRSKSTSRRRCRA
jgi:polyhydroxyalkanoate synthase